MRRAEEGSLAAVPETQVIVKRADELEALFRDHHNRVISTAYRITGSLADAEDVAQSVFLRLARYGRQRGAGSAARASGFAILDARPGRGAPLQEPFTIA